MQFDFCRAALCDAQSLRCAQGQIDHPIAGKRPAVVHAHHHAAPVAYMGHAHITRDGQGLVRSAQPVHVEALATGCGSPVKRMAVPGSDSALTMLGEIGARHVLSTGHQIRPVGPTMRGLDPWHRVGVGEHQRRRDRRRSDRGRRDGLWSRRHACRCFSTRLYDGLRDDWLR